MLSKGEGYTKVIDFNSGEDKIRIDSGASGILLETIGGNVEIRQYGDLLSIIEGQTDISIISDGLLF